MVNTESKTFTAFKKPEIVLATLLGIQLLILVAKVVENCRDALALQSQIQLLSFQNARATGIVVLFHLALLGLGLMLSPLAARPQRSVLLRMSYGFLFHVSALSLLHYVYLMATGRFFGSLNWIYAGVGGLLIVFRKGYAILPEFARFIRTILQNWNGARTLLILIVLSQAFFLFFPYHHCDAAEFYAKKAFLIQRQSDYRALTVEPASSYPPLYSIQLWMGMGDRLFEGRIVPFLWFLFFLVILLGRIKSLPIAFPEWVLVFFAATSSVWLGVISYYANVPLMIFFCSGFFLIMDHIEDPGLKPFLKNRETIIGVVLLSAAALIRPDGLLSLLIGLSALWVFLRFKKAGQLLLAAAIPVLFRLSWSFRPESFRGDPLFFDRISESVLQGWGAGLHWKTVENFLYATQGLIFSHYGFGIFFYLLIAAGVLISFRKKPVGRIPTPYGLLSTFSLLGVFCLYLTIGLFFNPTMAYVLYIRVSLGRNILHFYPFLLLFMAIVFSHQFFSRNLENPKDS